MSLRYLKAATMFPVIEVCSPFESFPKMRIVGKKNRDEIELDPVQAFRRGQVLDAMLRSALPPIKRGVYRGTHAEFNRIDAERMVGIACRVNHK